MLLQEKIAGCLIGGAVGDALGYQIEFKRNIHDKQITRFKNSPCVISDDTQMTLFTANGLIWYKANSGRGKTDISPTEAVYEAYLDWFDTQEGFPNHKSISWIKDIPELNKMRAPGNTCLRSLQSKQMGTIETRINNSKGCGSIMRIAPCALVANSATEAAKLAAECGAITHGHTLALLPCYVCAHMIHTILFDGLEINDALQLAITALKADRALFQEKAIYLRSSNLASFIDLIEKAIHLSKQQLTDTRAIRMIGEGWVADEAFAIVLYSCLKYPNSFEDAIVCAVNHDGDSDSTGAIAGNIMGAILGLSQIPTYYTDNVELKDIILELANDLLHSRELAKENIHQLDTNWDKKYHIYP